MNKEMFLSYITDNLKEIQDVLGISKPGITYRSMRIALQPFDALTEPIYTVVSNSLGCNLIEFIRTFDGEYRLTFDRALIDTIDNYTKIYISISAPFNTGESTLPNVVANISYQFTMLDEYQMTLHVVNTATGSTEERLLHNQIITIEIYG